MERNKKYTEIKNIFGNNFIGIDEIYDIDPKKQFISIDNIEYSNIPYSIDFLKDKCNEYILFYFQPIINNKLKFSINNLNTIKKIELLNNELGEEIKNGYELERDKYFGWGIGFGDMMLFELKKKLKSK